MAVLELVATLAVVLGVAVWPILRDGLEARRRERAGANVWAGAARAAGLTMIEARGGALEARAGALKLRITPYYETQYEGTRIELWGPRLAPGLSLRLEAGVPRPNRKEVEIGADAFDRQVSVEGSPALALALLDPATRDALVALLLGRLEVRGRSRLVVSHLVDGVLRIDVPAPAAAGLSGATVQAAVDLATRFVAPANMAERLAANLRAEPEAGVRRKLLATLLREFPESPATEAAVRACRDDADADVRVRAAVAMGKEGREVLLAAATGEGAEDATKARAVAALDTALSLAQVQELLTSTLRSRRPLTARACLGILGQLGGADAIQTLGKVLLVEQNELGEAAARALSATGEATAQTPLLRALAEGPIALKRAAAAALGRVGTRDAVAKLREAEADSELRAAARQAIAEIHARLAGAEHGQLSLAEGEAGRLSLAEGEAGRLSLSDEKPR
jgi:hypothetical protein